MKWMQVRGKTSKDRSRRAYFTRVMTADLVLKEAANSSSKEREALRMKRTSLSHLAGGNCPETRTIPPYTAESKIKRGQFKGKRIPALPEHAT